MAVQTTLASLSQTAALNGPDGAVDPPSSLDDALRYHGAFIAQLRDGVGFTSGPVIDRAYAEYTTNAALTTQIPGDDTIPQNTEGTQILSVAFTPKRVTNRLRLRFQGEFSDDTAGGSCGFAIFSSASANALRATLVTVPGAAQPAQVCMEYEYVPGVTTALTFSVRVGPLGATTMRMNGTTAARFFGGTMGATLVVEEIAA